MALPSLDPIGWLFWLINAGLYGFSDIVSRDFIPVDQFKARDGGSILLFEGLMVLVMLIMLNLLIAIMNSACAWDFRLIMHSPLTLPTFELLTLPR